MQETRYTEKQILCGIFECWCDALGYDEDEMEMDPPFSAETRIDLHMKAHNDWADTDLADIFYRLERHFKFQSTLEEWTEELGIANVPSVEVWENEIAPQFTFGALARFIQKRAVNTVSFEPVMVINKECRSAGVFYGIEQISNQLVSAKCQVTPSTKILDAFRGYQLNSFWSELSWRSEVRLPRLTRRWDFITRWGCMIAFWVLLVAFPALVFMENFYILLGAVLYVISIWFTDSVYTHYSDPLPPELQTFRDLAVWIVDHGGDAEWIPANVAPN
ncbi:MAG: hypothetical protein KDA70_11595 [Planctomycetaceae bacterium]|nr:hypothetical protein [Planctomycetaceae bacterium]MCA9022731.1 hypothetical protein [Planctomycetaceae bacterium]